MIDLSILNDSHSSLILFKCFEIQVTGKFYSGDSYILLKTTRKGSSMSWNIHFWLGAESSQDETGVAAYKSVELDDSLGGGPVQYREVQGSESDLFLTYFKKTGGIEYMDGGIDSGFHHVERDVYETRLLHLKGKRTVRVKSVPVSNASLNTGDVFILDTFNEIFVWVGACANEEEKRLTAELAKHYIEGAPDCRDDDCPIITVTQGSEPLFFTCHFRGWDPIKAVDFEDPYVKKMQALGVRPYQKY